MNSPRPTVALVLETNNLRGGEGEERIVRSLARLLSDLLSQTRSVDTLDEIVVTHDGLDAAARARLDEALGRPIRFVEVGEDTGYYEAKNRGFDATAAEVVAFADADCVPDSVWLERLLAPFEDGETMVVAGRTTYRDDVLGAAASAIDFMYFDSPLGDGLTRNFYANNVAFRRETFARFRYVAAEGVYRGHCQRLGLALGAARIPIRFEPAARTVHRFPDEAREFVRLRMLRGADTTEMAPSFASALLPKGLRWLGRTGPLAPLTVLGVRFVFSQNALGKQDLRALRGVRRLAARGVIAGISALDAAGAMGKAVLGRDFGVRDGALTRDALSYHRGHAVREGLWPV